MQRNSSGTRSSAQPPYLVRSGPPAIARLPRIAFAWLALAAHIATATVPAGFQDELVTNGLQLPAGMSFAPDGRLLVLEKNSGAIRLVKAGALVATPFLSIPATVPNGTFFDYYFERGLLGMAFDPAFATNGFVYVYYTLCKQPNAGGTPGTGTGCSLAKNRVVRFHVTGDAAEAGSALVVLDDIDSDAGNHNGGWIGFGPLDGYLYVATGDGGSIHTKSQDLASLNGKILRIAANGTVPGTNPFVGQGGARPEVWALGLRNPWRCRFHPDGRLLCGDVGQSTCEEVDLVTAGANYGWPNAEGPCDGSPPTPGYTAPIYAYNHNGASASITGGDFGIRTGFPGETNAYYFGDYALGWIRRGTLIGGTLTVDPDPPFGSGLGNPTDIVAGPDGALYYNSIGTGEVRRIVAIGGNRSPVAAIGATPTSGLPPLSIQFSSSGSADPDGDPITFLWDFGDQTPTSTAANPTHDYTAPGTYTARLTISDGKPSPGPTSTTIDIRVGSPPEITNTSPAAGSHFRAGDTINLSASATDVDGDGLTFHWRIDFHHQTHTHPFIADLPGASQSFITTTSGETDWDVGYDIHLTVTDTTGLSTSTVFEILPDVTTLTLKTVPPGLTLLLDGTPIPTPAAVLSVVGMQRTIGVPSPQGGYTFASWSDSGAASHTILTPDVPTAYTATFTAPPTTSTSSTSTSTSLPTTSTSSTSTSTSPPTTSTSSTSTSTSLPTTSSSSSTSTSSTTSTSTTSTTAPVSTTSSSVTTSSTTSTSTTSSSTTFSTSSTSSTSTSSTSTSSSIPSTSTTSSSTSSTPQPTSSTSTSVTSTTVPTTCDATSCDDGDACTLDVCGALGCDLQPVAPLTPVGLRCGLVNLNRLLAVDALCASGCPAVVANRLSRFETLLGRAVDGSSDLTCRVRFARALRSLSSLERTLGRFIFSGAEVATETQITLLRTRLREFRRVSCPL